MAEVDAAGWWIGLDGWVLQDGNYTEFEVGERRQFALELSTRPPHGLHATSERTPRARPAAERAAYDVVGRVERTATQEGLQDASVIDLGEVRAFSHFLRLADQQPVAPGDWVKGTLTLGVDYFGWMDRMAHLPGTPPLIHTWAIEAIETTDGGTVTRTAAWEEDCSYHLLCRLDPAPPSRTVFRRHGWPVGPLPG